MKLVVSYINLCHSRSQPRIRNLVPRPLFPPLKPGKSTLGTKLGSSRNVWIQSVFLPGTLSGHFLIMNCVLNLYERREAKFTLVWLAFVICAIRLPEAALLNQGYRVGSIN